MTETTARSDGDVPGGDDLRAVVAGFLRDQAPACARLGSTLYAHLLARAAEDVEAGGPVWSVLAPHADADRGAAIALRLLAAVHRLALAGAAPRLAAIYPSTGGSGALDGAWEAFVGTVEEHAGALGELVGWSCQTNEVGRSAGLVGGFLLAAREFGLPLRLLELGASGGLQLRWDRFRYEWDERPATHHWGPQDSPVRLTGHWDLPVDLLATGVTVTQRRGCDPDPVDVATPEGRLRLRQSVWADQPARFARLDGALRLAEALPAGVDRASAGTWLPAQLAEPAPGQLTVVYHSVVWQYLSPGDRDAVRYALEAAGARATRDAPLAWVRSEPENILRAMRVRLTLWPGGQTHLVAKAGAHGFPVRWQHP